MIKPLSVIILGILIYIILNHVDGFSIGGLNIDDPCTTDRSCNIGPGDCNDICLCDTDNTCYQDPVEFLRRRGGGAMAPAPAPASAGGIIKYEPLRKVDGGYVFFDVPLTIDKNDYGQILVDPTDQDNAGRQRRIAILLDTLSIFEVSARTLNYHHLALDNLNRWISENMRKAQVFRRGISIYIIEGDWGDVTLNLTKEYATTFAVLNMANAYSPGGGYTHGAAAQEENMCRRTDCHFYMNRNEELYLDQRVNKYKYNTEYTNLINGVNGLVYLDTDYPRICIREGEKLKSETGGSEGMGYDMLDRENIFMFYELRSAAADLGNHARGNFSTASKYDDAEIKHQTRIQNESRIVAQIETLKSKYIRHVVLSAFGCGAFFNDAHTIAQIYVEVLSRNKEHFDVVVFAIYYPGFGNDNYPHFRDVFMGSELKENIRIIPDTQCAPSIEPVSECNIM